MDDPLFPSFRREYGTPCVCPHSSGITSPNQLPPQPCLVRTISFHLIDAKRARYANVLALCAFLVHVLAIRVWRVAFELFPGHRLAYKRTDGGLVLHDRVVSLEIVQNYPPLLWGRDASCLLILRYVVNACGIMGKRLLL